MPWSEPNRIAAEAVIVWGGTVQIRLKGQQDDQPVDAVPDLPAADYQVTRVSLAGVQKPLNEVWLKLMALSDPRFDRLEAIDLSRLDVNDNHIPALKSLTSLTELLLTGTQVTDAGLAQLKDLKSLRHLVLDGCPINGTGFTVTNNAPDQPQAFTSLTDLSLARTQMNDANLAHLKDAKGLRRLILDGCTIRGTGLVHLKDIPELTELGLGCPTLTDVFANRLIELKQLQKLALAGSGLSDAGIKHLSGLTKLESLDLRRTKATAAGITDLQAALPKCQIQWDGMQDK